MAAPFQGVTLQVDGLSAPRPTIAARTSSINLSQVGRGPAACRRTAQRQLAGGNPRSRLDFPTAHDAPHARSLSGNPIIARGSCAAAAPGYGPTTTTPEPCGGCFRSLTRRSVRNSSGMSCRAGYRSANIARGFTPHPKRRTAPYSRFCRAVREPGREHRTPPSTAWEDGGNAVLQVGLAAGVLFVCGGPGCWLERRSTRNQNGGTTVL
jgi:hypothetical protein